VPKGFRQRRPDGAGGWIWNMKGARRVLFRLPELRAGIAAGKAVYVTEGEKDALEIASAGGVATCNPGGAGKWREEYSAQLRGAEVIVVADRDEPGRAHAEAVAASLRGIASQVRIVEAKEGKDAHDHLAAGFGLEESVALRDEALEDEPRRSGAQHCTDSGNAELFIDYCGERVRYCAADSSWYIHDGWRWTRDTTLAIDDLAGKALRGIYGEAAAEDDPEARAVLRKWAAASEAAMRRNACVEIARSDRRVAIEPSDFDRDGWLLNCLNGTLDLRSGELHGHDPADLISKLAPVDYDPGARSALWERVVAEATGNDALYLEHLQRFLGACLTADTTAEYFAVAIGPTETAKSTVLGAVRKVMGDYAADVAPETFCTRSQVGGTRDDLLRLARVRLALIPEADKRRHLDEAMLKRFVSGEDWPIRGVYRRDRDLHPVAKVIFHTNEMPQMSDADDAVWRRALSWPFVHHPEVIDETIKPALLDLDVSGPAILAWLIEGCCAWQRGGGGKLGLGRSTTVDQARAVLRESMNPLLDFFAERCSAPRPGSCRPSGRPPRA
jgi:putative DNA primase/helicase